MAKIDWNLQSIMNDAGSYSPATGVSSGIPFDNTPEQSLSGALFRQENLFGSLAQNVKFARARRLAEPEEDFNYFDHVPLDLLNHTDKFVTAKSIQEMSVIASQIRQEESDRMTMAGSPVASFFLGAVIGNLDPSIMMPGSIMYKEAKATHSVLKTALSVSSAAALQTGVQEIGLSSMQQTRTLDESAFNVLGASLLGGVLGGIGGKVASGPVGLKARKDIVDTYLHGLGEPHMDTLSAAKLNVDYLKASESIGSPVGRLVGKLASILTPANRLRESSFLTSKLVSEQLFESNVVKVKNLATGENTAKVRDVETGIRLSFAEGEKALAEYQDIYFNQAGIKSGPAKGLRAIASKQGLGFEQFDREVTNAMRNGDVHANPQVQQAAQLLRKKIFDPLKDRAIELGLLPENVDVKTATSYMLRQYNRQAIKENRNGFRESVRPWFHQKNNERKVLDPIIKKFTGEIKQKERLLDNQRQLQARLKAMEAKRSGDFQAITKELRDLHQDMVDSIKNRSDILTTRQERNLEKLIEKEQALDKLYERFGEKQSKVTKEIAELETKIEKTEKELAGLEKNKQQAIQVVKDKYSKRLEKIGKSPKDDTKKNIREQQSKELKKVEADFARQKSKLESEKSRFEKQVQSRNSQLKKIEGDFELQAKSAEKAVNEAEKTFELLEGKDAQIARKQAQLEKERFRNAIRSKTGTLKEIKRAKKKLQANDPARVEANIKQLQEDLESQVPHDLRDSNGRIRNILEDDQIELAIDQTIDNILGRSDQKVMNPLFKGLSAKGGPNPINNRAFLIPDEMIKDWTVNGAQDLAHNYMRSMVPTVHLEAFARRIVEPKARSGAAERALSEIEKMKVERAKPELSPQEKLQLDTKIADAEIDIKKYDLAPTKDEAQGQILRDLKTELEQALEGASPEQARKLEKQFDKDVRDIEASFEILEGVYGLPQGIADTKAAKVANAIKTWNFIRLMGFMTISSLPDIGMHILTHGPMAFMRDGLMPMLTRMNSLKLNKEFIQDMGLAIETQRGMRLKSFLDHDHTGNSTGLFGRALDFTSNTFGNASLMNQWQDMNQVMAGNMSISRTLRAIDNWAKTGKMSDADRTRLNTLAIDKKHWQTIHEQWQAHGGTENGSYFVNKGAWDIDNPDIAQAYGSFREAVFKEVNSVAIIPGMGDKSLTSLSRDPVFGLPFGSMMLQFKSFMFAATNKVLVAGLSRNDANFYLGAVSMLTMGAMGYMVSSKLRNPDEEIDLSWDRVLKESIDRSGLLGVFMEAFNMGEKLLGTNGVSRYNTRGVTGAFFGPTAGIAEEVAYLLNKFSRSIQDDDVNLTTKDAEKLMRLMPYQNLFYLYNLNRQVTKKAALGLGFEET